MATKLVARERKDFEALLFVLLMKFLKFNVVILRVPSLGCNVDDENNITAQAIETTIVKREKKKEEKKKNRPPVIT